MNIEMLKKAESDFMAQYPGGFQHPEMQALLKKHKMEKLTEFAKMSFAIERFDDPNTICNDMVKLISRSTMVSLFEKPKFRDTVKIMSEEQKIELSDAIKELLHGEEAEGFVRLGMLLDTYGLAKWTLMTAVQAYYNPHFDVFMKPTTVKGIIQIFGITELTYRATPHYEFYSIYRKNIGEMIRVVDERLSPSTAAFSGFLMMIMEGL